MRIYYKAFPEVYTNYDLSFASVRRIFFGDFKKFKVLMLENGSLLQLDTNNNVTTLLEIKVRKKYKTLMLENGSLLQLYTNNNVVTLLGIDEKT